MLVDYGDTIAAVDSHGIPLAADTDELSGLDAGWVVLGEISGVSDGLVFVDSALDAGAVDGRGATVVTHTADLSHLDLLYASPITGQLLIDAADAGGPDEQWMRGFGKRYSDADTLGWVENVLADAVIEPPGTTPPTSSTDDEVSDPEADAEFDRPCGSCATTPHAGWLFLPLLLLFRRTE